MTNDTTERHLSPGGEQAASPNGSDVLASLPRHRPGRRTSRRDAAAVSRSGAATGSTAKAGATKRDAGKGAAGKAGTAKRASKGAAKSRASGASARSSSARSRSARGASGPRSSGRAASRSRVIPEQGFEVEEEVLIGRAVEPPSRFELATSLVEIAGEGVEGLVKTSVSAAGSLLKRTRELIPKP